MGGISWLQHARTELKGGFGHSFLVVEDIFECVCSSCGAARFNVRFLGIVDRVFFGGVISSVSTSYV